MRDAMRAPGIGALVAALFVVVQPTRAPAAAPGPAPAPPAPEPTAPEPEPKPAAAEPTPLPPDPGALEPDAPEPGAPEPSKPARKERRAKARKSDLPLVHAKLGRFWMFLAPLELEVATGWAHHWENRSVEGVLVDGRVGFEPQLRFRKGRFRVRAPLSFGQRATIGFALPETRLGVGLAASGRPNDVLEIAGAARFTRRWRFGWDDFYQPRVAGEAPYDLASTDRYGRASLAGELDVDYTPSDIFEIGLELERETSADDRDPAYDPVLAPTHLVPADFERWAVTLRLRTEPIEDRLHADLTLRLETFDFLALFARDASTGVTHAGVGGVEANPLQAFVRWTLAPDLSLLVATIDTRLSLDLRWVHNDDTFQGYYRWDSLGGTIRARVRPSDDLRIEVGYGLDVRGYTHDGYQTSATHAPLERGEVRRLVSHEVGATVTWVAVDDALEPFIDARWSAHEDTMPDYAPWRNPPGEPYTIDFDASWWSVRVGASLRM